MHKLAALAPLVGLAIRGLSILSLVGILVYLAVSFVHFAINPIDQVFKSTFWVVFVVSVVAVVASSAFKMTTSAIKRALEKENEQLMAGTWAPKAQKISPVAAPPVKVEEYTIELDERSYLITRSASQPTTGTRYSIFDIANSTEDEFTAITLFSSLNIEKVASKAIRAKISRS